MLGVRPIIPCVYAPMFHIPMSSPKMTTMLGFLPWAAAGAEDSARAATASRIAARPTRPLDTAVIIVLLCFTHDQGRAPPGQSDFGAGTPCTKGQARVAHNVAMQWLRRASLAVTLVAWACVGGLQEQPKEES